MINDEHLIITALNNFPLQPQKNYLQLQVYPKLHVNGEYFNMKKCNFVTLIVHLGKTFKILISCRQHQHAENKKEEEEMSVVMYKIVSTVKISSQKIVSQLNWTIYRLYNIRSCSLQENKKNE